MNIHTPRPFVSAETATRESVNAPATARELAQDGEPANGCTTEPESATCQSEGGFGAVAGQAILTAIAAEKAEWPHAGAKHDGAREACNNIIRKLQARGE